MTEGQLAKKLPYDLWLRDNEGQLTKKMKEGQLTKKMKAGGS